MATQTHIAIYHVVGTEAMVYVEDVAYKADDSDHGIPEKYFDDYYAFIDIYDDGSAGFEYGQGCYEKIDQQASREELGAAIDKWFKDLF